MTQQEQIATKLNLISLYIQACNTDDEYIKEYIRIALAPVAAPVAA